MVPEHVLLYQFSFIFVVCNAYVYMYKHATDFRAPIGICENVVYASFDITPHALCNALLVLDLGFGKAPVLVWVLLPLHIIVMLGFVTWDIIHIDATGIPHMMTLCFKYCVLLPNAGSQSYRMISVVVIGFSLVLRHTCA